MILYHISFFSNHICKIPLKMDWYRKWNYMSSQAYQYEGVQIIDVADWLAEAGI